ncbi:sigma 54 modulation protein/ribosomal protein S30EA [Alkalidesulfovibrio alkalitolerans DSM 16529]|jgi:putative sigma-54 modulation protein|uniref:Ribosome hibernation promoting factor n=1 Tax=Alkalidesulfovibrio alkalitolerans DSM 16529 TaxID=1121439 RepID=S7U9U8_9BACT|nr:ribosome-associated translation inhibitor RaiA [Alkalidesulfovibrio alkalitolerans]EPR30699.1 sigma 54 modulation protein/ribosomal protein S30EA [Alkalidesulfovibrio alkalitolerans DSM 16529]
MNIAFNFKNFDPSEHLKDYAAKRFEKLSKYLSNTEDSEVQVNLSVEKIRQVAEVTVSDDNLHLSANESSEDMYSTIDMVLDKVLAQLKRIREKQKNKRGGKAETRAVRMDVISFTGEGDARTKSIVGTDHFDPKPMDVEEAAMQLESLDYEFLVFLNAETERLNVIYRRNDREFGLIDPGF